MIMHAVQRSRTLWLIALACLVGPLLAPAVRVTAQTGTVRIIHTLTMADNGTTLAIPVGDEVHVQLDTTLNWSFSVDDAQVLQALPAASGAEALYQAAAPGQATITATGTAKCQPGMVCPLFAVEWSATIIVTGGGSTGGPTTHTLMMADNGTTISAQVGDTIVIKLDPALNWAADVQPTGLLFRPPVAVVRGVQDIFEAIAPGQVVITETGSPACLQASPPCAAPSQLWQVTIVIQGGTLHVLTPTDSGSTLTVAAGDYVRIDATPLNATNVASSDPAVLQPVAVPFYHVPLFEAVAPGQATITATLNPACYPRCLVASRPFSVTVVVTGSAPPGTITVTYQPGWNLIGVPSGTTLPVDAYAWDATHQAYSLVPAGQPLKGGVGYWAFFTSATPVALAAGGATTTAAGQTITTVAAVSIAVAAPPGAWVMVGNPGTGVAHVSGADAVYIWDARAGQYLASSTLQPGQGAWAIAYAGGTITVQ